jgi:carbamoyl-phosphate synthase large subunit
MTSSDHRRILVTGAGGVAGVNFVRALRTSTRHYSITGTEYNRYYIDLPDLDSRYHSPRHDDPDFVSRIIEVATEEHVDFIHPQPSSEAFALASRRGELPAPVLLPSATVMEVAQDKLLTQKSLQSSSVPVAKTRSLTDAAEVESAFNEIGPPVWVRARHGAGGRLSLLCEDAAQAELWLALWAGRKVPLAEFILQEYLPGRNIAWDSVWLGGKLVTSYCRERLEYPFKHVSPSGITGTPSVSRTVLDDRVNTVSERAVRAVAPGASGAFSIDIKEDQQGRPVVTEVDAGKMHTTMPLWGYIAVKHLKLPWYSNFADLYVRLGLGEEVPSEAPSFDLIPAGYYMIRNMDSGVLLRREDGWKERVL